MHTRLLAAFSLALLALPAAVMPVQAAVDSQIQRYQRKYISFFYPQNYPLNEALSSAFRRGFPRFDYHLASTSLNMDFATFLQQTRDYQAQVAGDIAAGREVENPRFGDKVVSWSETQQITKSAYVFVPVWKMGKVSVDGPYATNTSSPQTAVWRIDAQSNTRLEMEIWNLAGDEPERVDDVQRSWTVTKQQATTVTVGEMIAAAESYNRTVSKDDQIDLSKSITSSQREELLKRLRENTAIDARFKSIEVQDPYTYMMADAVSDVGYGSVISAIQSMPAFLIRAEIDNADMAKDQVVIKLGTGETAQSLGIHMDSGYKVVEYLKGHKDPREIGYMKIRELKGGALDAQPIIVGRDFELGDQVVEYPKAGFGINLRGGVNLDTSFSRLGGGGGLDLDFNIGPGFNVSELYFDLSGGYYNGLLLFEGGLQKKWFWRQLVFQLGLRAGGSFGQLPGGGDDNGFGLTGLAGLQWQATPDFAFGVDTGWRQYSNLAGPLLEGFIRFDL